MVDTVALGLYKIKFVNKHTGIRCTPSLSCVLGIAAMEEACN